MLRKIPKPGWLLLSLILWAVSIFYYRSHRIAVLPEQMVRMINNDLAYQNAELNRLLNDQQTVKKIFSDSLSSKEVSALCDKPFFLYAYDGDSLRFWNNNYVIAQNRDSLLVNLSLRKNLKGIFLRKYLRQTQLPGNKKLIVLFPLVISYPIENDYLHSHFAASENIPVKARISAISSDGLGEYRIVMGNETAAYITIGKDDIQKWTPDVWFIAVLVAAILSTVLWLQTLVKLVVGKAPGYVAPIVFTILIAAIRLILFEWGIPFNLDALTIFSPTLYASNRYLSSLGDLFISVLFVLWVVTFVIRHTDYHTFFNAIKNKTVKWITAVPMALFLGAYVLFTNKIIRSLILDSRISFDVTHFYSVTIYTAFGLLAIVSIMVISYLIIYLVNIQLDTLLPGRLYKYGVLISSFLLLLWGFGHIADVFYWSLEGSAMLFFVLLDVPRLRLSYNILKPHMVTWSLIICVFATLLVHYYNEVREKMVRMAFVEQRLSPHHDDQLELSFDKTARLIEKDRQLKNFFYKPNANARRALTPHLDSLYLSALNKYQTTVYLFDDEFRPLFNKDTTSYDLMMAEKTEAVITNSAYLFYRESILNRNYYISYLPVYNDTVNNFIGYMFVTLDQKKATNETVYPELLQPSAARNIPGDLDYSYAMYISGKLITQTNDYDFPVRLKYDTLKDQEYVFDSKGGYSMLYTKIADKRTAVVVHHHDELIEGLTLFAYLFGIEVGVAIIILLFQGYRYAALGNVITNFKRRLTIRRRVHVAILGIIIISFVVIGIITIWFFRSEYERTNDNKLQAAIQAAKQSVQSYLVKERAFNSKRIFDSVSRSTNFKSFVSSIATSQKIDINIFDEKGALLTTSQEDIYDKGLISRRMKPDAYYRLNNEGVSLVVQKEKVASLSYTAAYEALRNENGQTLGYINIPFFTSEKDIDFQVSNIIVTLLSFYAILFLFSSLIAVAVTGRITRSFEFIIKQFDKLNLEQNERIEWKYDDEIGRLVKEYNKMVRKVEENAAKLAQSERESAWREMARQVAHEIKNPLTPMKLNIQYLQQAMRNDNPNIKQLTERVSASIIEQIDNLSYIASEFSDFAKMPEAKPEDIDPAKLMEKAAELYTKDTALDVNVTLPEAEILVLCDRSQLLRVFTNLLENARQAIPDGRKGRIDIAVVNDGNNVMISIADNGTGINEEVSKRIFQPYFTTKNSGTGLGLAMTKKIIEFWKGDIWFETKENEGTTFFIRLPKIKSVSSGQAKQ